MPDESTIESNRKTFEELSRANPYFEGNDVAAYEILVGLDEDTPKAEVQRLEEAIGGIRYYSNCSSVFEFRFPIYAHLFACSPESAGRLLGGLISPLFALGLSEDHDPGEYVRAIQGNAAYHLERNPHYLSEAGREWVENTLPKLHREIKEILDRLVKENEED